MQCLGRTEWKVWLMQKYGAKCFPFEVLPLPFRVAGECGIQDKFSKNHVQKNWNFAGSCWVYR